MLVDEWCLMMLQPLGNITTTLSVRTPQWMWMDVARDEFDTGTG